MTEQEFRKLLAIQYFQKMKTRLTLFVIVSLANLALSIAKDNYFFSVISIATTIYYFSLPYLINLKKTQPKISFRKRWCEMDQDFISFIYEDGSLVKIRFDDFIQVIKRQNYYWMYSTYTQTQFFYLPVAAFNTEQDINRFDLLMQGKQLMKLW